MSTQVLQAVFEAVESKKGNNPVLLDMREISIITDYFLVTDGHNPIHVKAIAEGIKEGLGEIGFFPSRVEGHKEGRWILLDYGFLVAHILTGEERDFYRLEQLWHEAKVMTPNYS